MGRVVNPTLAPVLKENFLSEGKVTSYWSNGRGCNKCCVTF